MAGLAREGCSRALPHLPKAGRYGAPGGPAYWGNKNQRLRFASFITSSNLLQPS